MQQKTIAFIGGGNMAQALVGGLLSGGYAAQHIWVTEPSQDHLTLLQQRWGVQTTTDNNYAAIQADVLILAVKPQVLREVCVAMQSSIQQSKPLIISVAAGVPVQALETWLGEGLSIVRSMPNTPALAKVGATGLFANTHVDVAQRNLTEQLLKAVGITAWLDTEDQIDAITALSGSGPAYIFYMMDVLEKVGIAAGLAPEIAHHFTLQTVLGAAMLAQQSTDTVSELCRKVTSPNGTTARALDVLNAHQVNKHLTEAVLAAKTRAQELAKEFVQ